MELKALQGKRGQHQDRRWCYDHGLDGSGMSKLHLLQAQTLPSLTFPDRTQTLTLTLAPELQHPYLLQKSSKQIPKNIKNQTLRVKPPH